MVISSIKDNPVKLRDFKYIVKDRPHEKTDAIKDEIALIINDKHDIHHIKEVGYIESPIRIGSIYKEITKTASGFRVALLSTKLQKDVFLYSESILLTSEIEPS